MSAPAVKKEEKKDKNAVYIGQNPVHVYVDFAFTLLQKTGTAKIMAMGLRISTAIVVVHKILTRFAGVRLMDEHTSLVEMEDNRPPRPVDPEQTQSTFHRSYQPRDGPRLRKVAVYQATLAYEPVQPKATAA